MKIKYLRAKNFLSIGEKQLEIDLTKYGNIINLKGQNGVGKSNIINILLYGLYGKLSKGLSHKEAINVDARKNLEVEVHWDNYRVIRRRSPDRLQLWEGDKDISLGGIPSTDELIRSIIKLNCNSFINVAFFGQHNNYAFLSCDPAEKRQIAENLLSLDKYVTFWKAAKEKLKDVKDKISALSSSYQGYLDDLSSAKKKLSVLQDQQQQWKDGKLKNISLMEIKITEINKNLEEVKNNKGICDHEKLALVEMEIAKREKSRIDLHVILEKADNAIQRKRDEKQELAIEVSRYDRDEVITTKEIEQLNDDCDHIRNEKGAFCNYCYNQITELNIPKMIQRDLEKIESHKEKLIQIGEKKQTAAQKLAACEDHLAKLLEGRKTARDKEIQNLNLLTSAMDEKRKIDKRGDKTSEIMLIEKDIQHLSDKLLQAKNELSKDPYHQMIEMVKSENEQIQSKVNNYKIEMKELENKIPYYSFWVKAFGDEGIRAFVIEEIIPALNSRVNYWLQFLIDGKFELLFNNKLEETIKRIPEGKSLSYNCLSGGQHCRIDLAISQAFAHVMMVTAGTVPSVVCLDEIGANIDRAGIESIYKMICELSRHRQIIVVTHDPDLLDLLSGCDAIEVAMENGFTILKN